jgi:hypothetical protein
MSERMRSLSLFGLKDRANALPVPALTLILETALFLLLIASTSGR